MAKTGIPKLFKSYSEIESRENFNSACRITPDNVASLIGPYTFPEKEKCQVDRPVKGYCGNPHNNGWLGLTKDGKEALIGSNCAANHFDADENFVLEQRRINREISISDSLDTLNNLLSNRGELDKLLEAEITRMRRLRSSRTSLQSRLPPMLLQTLTAMAKTGSRSVSIQVQL